ncbi:DEAD/DEAH box helicase [Thiohalorhabdus methylotrophus]|uniref:DEAD/DEAH box helicase n=1 Tax=Thiohalorhabdus methylotrophus TaxID=3242694 RepID=A0ABV4TZ79_9GAMM
MAEIIWGSTPKPVSSQQLASFFDEKGDSIDGFLYIGYPLIGTPEGRFRIDATLVSPTYGVVLFNLVEGRDIEDYEDEQDETYNRIVAKFRNHKTLTKGRKLIIEPWVVTFAPAAQFSPDPTGDYPITNTKTLDSFFDSLPDIDPKVYEPTLSVVQSISTIRKGKRKRNLKDPNSRGSTLKFLEDSIANLDNQQGHAVIETVDDVQRIRGLAGSGKTIVLALKAAYLHAQNPDWKIAVTFHTRALKGQFHQLINTFVIEQTNEEPDWKNIEIINAWGAPGGQDRDGIYYRFCQRNGLEFYDYTSAKRSFGRGYEFEGACEEALTQVTDPQPEYDAILVDEAQDFAPAFLRICYESLGETKRLVYAYDELQSLSEKSLPPPEEVFGYNSEGEPRVRFTEPEPGKPKQDIILEKCYRNSRPVLTTAHALGFGIYREPDSRTGTGLIQMFDHRELWLDVGYEVLDGALEDGSRVLLGRTENSSPAFLEDHSPKNDLIQFHCFHDKDEQASWLSQEIQKNLNEEELQFDDIIIINPDPLTTRKEVGPVRETLFNNGINSHLAGVDTSPDVFFEPDGESLAFTGIYRAKGNEAGMVYIMNAQDCYSSFGNLARVRNRLFSAITRSKAWVRVLGVGENMEKLIEEFNEVRGKKFNLDFTYPTEEQREHLNIVNRDMSTEEKQRLEKGTKDLSKLLDDIEAGNLFLSDLPEEQIARLKTLLGGKE